MSRLRGNESGFTLIEVLLVSVLTTVILGATLAVFNAMERNQRQSRSTNEIQDDTRQVLDQLAKQMRNVASPTQNTFRPIERAEPDDVIFRVVSKTGTSTATNPTNIQRVRYCLDNASQLYAQTQLLADSTTAAPAGQACPQPGSGWTSQRLVNGTIVNGTRPVFTYLLSQPDPLPFVEQDTVTLVDDLERIVSVRVQIYADDDVTKSPPASRLNTRIFLRNQNIKPTASFVGNPTGAMSLQLNGSASEDPEGGRLTFEWYDDAVAGTDKKIGEGAVFIYSPSTGLRTIWLKVTDPGGNYAVAAVQNFTCQISTGCVAS